MTRIELRELLEELEQSHVSHAPDCPSRQHTAAECTCIRSRLQEAIAELDALGVTEGSDMAKRFAVYNFDQDALATAFLFSTREAAQDVADMSDDNIVLDLGDIARGPESGQQRCDCCDEFSDDVKSTFCGLMCGTCRKTHATECEVCRDDFVQRGIL